MTRSGLGVYHDWLVGAGIFPDRMSPWASAGAYAFSTSLASFEFTACWAAALPVENGSVVGASTDRPQVTSVCEYLKSLVTTLLVTPLGRTVPLNRTPAVSLSCACIAVTSSLLSAFAGISVRAGWASAPPAASASAYRRGRYRRGQPDRRPGPHPRHRGGHRTAELVDNGLTTLQINSNYTDIVLGCVLGPAVTAGRLRARSVARRG